MKRKNRIARPTALLATAVLSGLLLSSCGDPRLEENSSGDSGGSMITETWNLEPVDSVAKLVPARYKNKPIKNGIYNDFPPQEFLEGDTLVGIQPDMALALGEVMGVELENVSVGSFDSLIPGIKSGRYDMSTADFGVTKERLGEVDFVTQFQVGTGFAVHETSDITISEATDLCGHSIGVQAGSYFIDQIEGADKECAAAGLDPIELKTFPNDGARNLAMSSKRIEVTATTEDALGYSIASGNLPMEMQEFVYEPLELGIVFRDGSDLAPAVAAAMKEIIENGTYQEILEKWGVEHVAYASSDEVLHLTEPSQNP